MFLTPLSKRYFAIFCAVCTLACLPLNAWSNSTPQVLVLNSYDESAMPYARAKNVFIQELQKAYSAPMSIRQFDLEERVKGEQSASELKARLLLEQYGVDPPELVVAIGPPAASFWLTHRSANLLNVPFVAVGADFVLSRFEFKSSDIVVATPFSFVDMVTDIRKVRPGAPHFLMVFGASKHERQLAALAKQELDGYSDQLSFEYTNEWELEKLQNRLEQLSPGSVVFYGVFDSDSNGVLLNNYSGLAMVRAASAVPVFGAFDDHLGRGIVGGRLILLEQLGRETARIANEILQGKSVDPAWRKIGLGAPEYDWRELKVWGIDSSLLPAGSFVRFEPPTAWEQYAVWILLAVLVFILQSLLVGSLWVQSRRLRQAKNTAGTLGRRLISAQEDERRLIARELHDDLSQRLAGLAIDASYAASEQGSDEANQVLRSLHPGLVRISKDVHDLSYRLHPSLLDDLGIVAALQAEFERLRHRSDAVIIEKFGEIPELIPRDVALCLYRIAQEAVHNAIRHARAGTIELILEGDDHELKLTVRDDGNGFDAVKDSGGTGLGLSSMRERAQLAGGTLNVRSQLGKGTTVSVIAPLPGTRK